MKEVHTIGIVGAGPMGVGITHVGVLAGYEVRVHDIDRPKLDALPDRVKGGIAIQVAKGLVKSADAKAALTRVHLTHTLSGLAACDLVIETVNEDEEVKRDLYASLKGVLKPDAILATDTSSISITRLAAATDRPQRFLGMHFMNPVPRMELVEIIPGIATLPEVMRLASDVAKRMGKTPVAAQDFPAFMVNRILAPMINEAIYVLYEGVGTVESIDAACKLGLHHPMGPLALADFIGLDIFLSIMKVLHEGLADQKYRPCPLLIKYVEAGWFGRKSGRGFYDYSVDPPKPTR
ncbi:MAG: 3-hydroxybutyryl-CoA dehydrogenase [Alphaproteobacteria bacterium]|nr:3-hydroxybutyryl-CoA dehydrogenase [Alphaproteobacteria bacterium]